MITAIIADDEPNLRTFLRKQLALAWPELHIVGEASNGTDALDLIQAKKPQIAFLDIQMPEMSGLEVAIKVAGTCKVVFISAYGHYALEAFDSAAIDYIVKPVKKERLEKTVQRLRANAVADVSDIAELLARLAKGLPPPTRHLQWIQASIRDEVMIVPVEEIDYFMASDNYTIAKTSAREYVIRKTLKELVEELDPDQFWRIHRNAIVRVSAIEKISRSFSGRYFVHLHNHTNNLGVGRSYTHIFKGM